MKKIPVLYKVPYNILKWSALFFMTYDHVLKNIFLVVPAEPVLIPGRFAFPLFIFMICWNIAHYDIIPKYLKRLLPFAIISLAVDFAFYKPIPLNILFSFILALAMIGLFKKIGQFKEKNNRYISYIYTGLFFSFLAHFADYGIAGIWIIFLMYKFFKTRNTLYYIGCLSLLSLTASSILAAFILLIFAGLLMLAEPIPSPKRSSFKRTGWLFYAYFPFHKLVIALISGWTIAA